ncbi:hypothetical protein AAFC00_000868 [Neodothiora populina]|uniref:FHA domain-containing protein n=1 Tax=Neodothiora populina TaxID=2781224 RepID=A0ABR3PLZ6_9PEZI
MMSQQVGLGDNRSVKISLECIDSGAFPESIRNIILKDGEDVTIGRASKSTSKNLKPAADNAYFDCPVMSRSHALFWWNTNVHRHVRIKDSNSLHGTYLNNARVSGVDAIIHTGDVIRFGDAVSRSHSIHDGVKVRVTLQYPRSYTKIAETAEAIQERHEVEESSFTQKQQDIPDIRAPVVDEYPTISNNTFKVPSESGDDQADRVCLDDDDDEDEKQSDDEITPSIGNARSENEDGEDDDEVDEVDKVDYDDEGEDDSRDETTLQHFSDVPVTKLGEDSDDQPITSVDSASVSDSLQVGEFSNKSSGSNKEIEDHMATPVIQSNIASTGTSGDIFANKGGSFYSAGCPPWKNTSLSQYSQSPLFLAAGRVLPDPASLKLPSLVASTSTRYEQQLPSIDHVPSFLQYDGTHADGEKTQAREGGVTSDGDDKSEDKSGTDVESINHLNEWVSKFAQEEDETFVPFSELGNESSMTASQSKEQDDQSDAHTSTFGYYWSPWSGEAAAVAPAPASEAAPVDSKKRKRTKEDELEAERTTDVRSMRHDSASQAKDLVTLEEAADDTQLSGSMGASTIRSRETMTAEVGGRPSAVGGCVATVSFLWSPLAERLLA